jgi:hypothetical protein
MTLHADLLYRFHINLLRSVESKSVIFLTPLSKERLIRAQFYEIRCCLTAVSKEVLH